MRGCETRVLRGTGTLARTPATDDITHCAIVCGGVDACAVEVTAVGRDAPIFDVDDEIARG